MSLASFLVSHPGISVADAAGATGRDVRTILDDCDQLQMCGVPPYTPTDLIRVDIDGYGDDATIRISSADYMANPIAFSPQETLALDWVLQHYRQSADADTQEQIDSLMQTLEESLHGRARETLSKRGKAFVVPRQTARQRELIADMVSAAEDHVVVELEYYSAHRGQLSKREVHPYGVIEIGAHFYLFAYCRMVEDTRHFRLDRVRTAKILDEDFPESAPKQRKLGQMESLFKGKPRGHMLVSLDSRVVVDVCEEWGSSPGAEVRWQPDGSAKLMLPIYNSNWAIGFLMALGEHAVLESPTWLRDELVATIEKSI
jgi:proteasome accessory factor C